MRYAKLLATALLILTAPAAHASNAAPGYITQIIPQNTGVMFVFTDGARSAAPACASGQPTRYSIDTSSAAGQALAATVLTAFALHKQIQIFGTHTCDTWGDTESISYFNLNN